MFFGWLSVLSFVLVTFYSSVVYNFVTLVYGDFHDGIITYLKMVMVSNGRAEKKKIIIGTKGNVRNNLPVSIRKQELMVLPNGLFLSLNIR